MEVTSSFLGKGITFPFVIENGAIKMDDYEALIKHSLEMILGWEYGIRFFNPEFGCKLWELQGEPNDVVLKALVKRFLLDAINSWESRISLLDIAITMPKAYTINIQCTYQINATRTVVDYNFQYSI